MRDVAFPHPFSGATFGRLFGVCVLPETYTLAPGSGCFSIVRIAGSTVDTGHSSVVGGFWLLFHTSQCEGGLGS